MSVEVHVTPCIVTMPPGDDCSVLVNPANERLVGTQFSPSEANAELLGSGIIYPPQAVDGLVTELGGPELRAACEAHGACEAGSAVVTAAFGELLVCYQHIVHTVAPFYGSPEWAAQLRGAYRAAFAAAASLETPASVIAVPLLGSGARGAPMGEAAAVAASALLPWGPWGRPAAGHGKGGIDCVRFATQDDQRADALLAALQPVLSSSP